VSTAIGRGVVLIVEDDVALRQAYGDILRDAGWTVIVAGDGLQAIEQLERGPRPCVVLLDLRMPRMNGWELVDWLKERSEWQRLPYLVVAAHVRVAEEAARLGALGWLQKPVPIDALVGAVADACGGAPSQ
jgi:CheY-like chemotaxis protein